MKWNDVMPPVQSISLEEAKALMRSKSLSTYEILDVRQPAEYAAGHIPGARLVPLPELIAGKGEIDQNKEYFVYCRAGSRSQAACQWLSQFARVKAQSLAGGFLVWNGKSATGAYEHNLHLIHPQTQFKDALGMAYVMEEGLKRIYIDLQQHIVDEPCRELLKRLASFEDQHKESIVCSCENPDFLEDNPLLGQIAETGTRIDQLIEHIRLFLNRPEDVFDFAMGIEAQAFDLYMRLSQTALSPATEKLFLDLAEEECTHLDLLKIEADRYFRQHSS